MRKLSTKITQSIVLMMIVLMVSSCRISIPAVKPLADNTAKMSTAIGTAYTNTETLLAQTDIDDKKLKELEKAWEPTKKALVALVAYSDSLAALADAGAKGKEGAQALADSLNSLIGAVQPIASIPTIPATVVNAFKAINSIVASMRARKALKEAVGDAEPAIETISEIITYNLKELKNINETAGTKILTDLRLKNQGLSNYYESLSVDNNRTMQILTLILDYQNKRDLEVLNQIKKLDPALPMSASDVDLEKRQKQLIDRGKELRMEFDRIDPEYKIFKAKENEVEDTKLKGNQVLGKSVLAVEAFSKAHSELKTALNTKSRLTIAELVSIVEEIAEIYKKEEK